MKGFRVGDLVQFYQDGDGGIVIRVGVGEEMPGGNMCIHEMQPMSPTKRAEYWAAAGGTEYLEILCEGGEINWYPTEWVEPLEDAP